MASAAWAEVEALFARGDVGFVAELRRCHAPEQLGAFAARWLADPRPFARDALLDYLDQPLNRYRHEPLVKRLFKLAEAARDDAVMGAMLVALDRAVRRRRVTRYEYRQQQFRTRAEAEAQADRWRAEGWEYAGAYAVAGQFHAHARRPGERVITPPNTTMPRPTERKRAEQLTDWARDRLERRTLFSLPTRRYLRRRAWRYFRLLGKADPKRYVVAASGFLPRYRDADVDSDVHLLDNWGLVHALFHHSPALERPARGWRFAEGKSLADLHCTPWQEAAWAADPARAFEMLLAAGCRTVRTFAVWVLKTHQPEWLRQQPVGTLLKLADHPDPDLSAFGFDLLETAPDLSVLPVDEWLRRLDGDDLDTLTRLAGLLKRRLDPDRVSRADALRLAAHRSRPVAALGLSLVRAKPFTVADIPALLVLAQADCATVRPELLLWLRATLEGFGPARTEWVLDFLDSKHADVRAAGWAWLSGSAVRDDPAVWHQLMESPYPDVREPLLELLATVAAGADPGVLRQLWATVLLGVRRGGRQKPGVVKQVVDRATTHPAEAPLLVPLLAVAVRSLRGPEFRAGLAGVVTLGETTPGLVPLIRQQFPELAV